MSRPPALPEGEQPSDAPLPAKLEPLVETARAYARAATSENTNRAYAADWREYLRWRARQGPDASASISRRWPQGRGREGPDRRHHRAAVSRRSCGISPRVPCPSTVRPAIL